MLFILEKRRLQGNLTVAFHNLKGCKKNGEGLSTRVCSDRARGSGLKMEESIFRLDTVKKFFTVSRLPGECGGNVKS